MNTQAVWLHSLSSQPRARLSYQGLAYSGFLMHGGGMNDWVIEAGDTEAVKPDYGLVHGLREQ